MRNNKLKCLFSLSFFILNSNCETREGALGMGCGIIMESRLFFINLSSISKTFWLLLTSSYAKGL